MDKLEANTIATVENFNDALNQHNLDQIVALLTEDTVFENTYPAPDGTLYQGLEVVKGFWEAFLRASPQARFDIEDIFASGNRCVMRWKYTWADETGQSTHIRGVDIFQVRDGKVSEKLSYVKG